MREGRPLSAACGLSTVCAHSRWISLSDGSSRSHPMSSSQRYILPSLRGGRARRRRSVYSTSRSQTLTFAQQVTQTHNAHHPVPNHAAGNLPHPRRRLHAAFPSQACHNCRQVTVRSIREPKSTRTPRAVVSALSVFAFLIFSCPLLAIPTSLASTIHISHLQYLYLGRGSTSPHNRSISGCLPIICTPNQYLQREFSSCVAICSFNSLDERPLNLREGIR